MTGELNLTSVGKNKFCSTAEKALRQFGQEIHQYSFLLGKEIIAHRCAGCGYINFQPPTEAELHQYYSTSYGAESSSWYNVDLDYETAKVESRAESVLATIDKYALPTDSVILELGCAFGGTVMELRRRGFQAYGVDLNDKAIKQGRERGNDHIFFTDVSGIEELAISNIDLVFSYHTLEHVPYPLRLLLEIKRHLTPSAVLCFRVPNGSYYRALFQGFSSWDWFAYPDHLHFLTPRSLLCLSRAAGYDLLRVETDACSESPDQTAAVVGQHFPNLAQATATETVEIMRACHMLLELQFDMSETGSAVAKRFSEAVKATRLRCLKSGICESALLHSVERGKDT